jgi:hypothetical protein
MRSSKTSFIYSNSKGDSLIAPKASESTVQTNEVVLDGIPGDATGEKYTQTVSIDTAFDYTTTLISEFNSGNRNDVVIIDALNIELLGNAEPNYILNGTFIDSLNLNGILYTNVFRQLSSNQENGLFVNIEDGLVAFILEKDTFNLVN